MCKTLEASFCKRDGQGTSATITHLDSLPTQRMIQKPIHRCRREPLVQEGQPRRHWILLSEESRARSRMRFFLLRKFMMPCAEHVTKLHEILPACQQQAPSHQHSLTCIRSLRTMRTRHVGAGTSQSGDIPPLHKICRYTSGPTCTREAR